MYELSSCLWIPKAEFTDDLRAALTVKVVPLVGDRYTVEAFRTDRKGWVGLPRVHGLKLVANAKYTDKRSAGAKAVFPRKVSLRDYQVPFAGDMYEAAMTQQDFIAEAATGKGKTVCALQVIQRIGKTAIVVVDQENLMDQWIERAGEHLGLAPEDIGIVRGPIATWEGKALTICMMQTLTQRKMPEEFYRHAGVVVFDESHTAGAPTFSKVLLMFDARVRFGVSATPDRRDVLHKVIGWSLGSVQALLASELEPSLLYLLEHDTTYSWRANSAKIAGRYLVEVSGDASRNLKIAQAAKWLYDTGRDVLVISDRVEHLSSLLALCKALGVPTDEMGIYAKSKTVYRYEKDPRPARRPEGYVRGTEYSPIRLSLMKKTVPKTELLRTKEQARIIFATYGIMAKGVDIPRLSAGIDATPRSEATQVIGRILRTMDGKLTPIWVTFADVNSFRSLYQLSCRLTDYKSSNAEVFLWDMTRGRKPLETRALVKQIASRIRDLRKAQIITRLDGSYTLLIPTMRLGKSS